MLELGTDSIAAQMAQGVYESTEEDANTDFDYIKGLRLGLASVSKDLSAIDAFIDLGDVFGVEFTKKVSEYIENVVDVVQIAIGLGNLYLSDKLIESYDDMLADHQALELVYEKLFIPAKLQLIEEQLKELVRRGVLKENKLIGSGSSGNRDIFKKTQFPKPKQTSPVELDIEGGAIPRGRINVKVKFKY